MTSLTPEKENIQLPEYRCVGSIRGQYLPSAEQFYEGVLVTDDGCQFPARLVKKALRWAHDHPEELAKAQIWSCWPHTRKETPALFLQLTAIRTNAGESHSDTFSIRGVVAFQNQEEGKLAIRIKRNGQPPEDQKDTRLWKPFPVEVEGFLPQQAWRQFWEITAVRQGERLVLSDAQLIQEAPPLKPKPERKKASLPARSKKKKAKAAPVEQPLAPKEPIMPVPGKLEITVKINQMPPFETVENNWKRFYIECDGRIFTVTVRPKLFKKLEDAQANYPSWVAAIAGKIGEATEKGFVLAEPNIQVFERKVKTEEKAEPNAPAEQPTDKQATAPPEKETVAEQPTSDKAAAPPEKEMVAEQPTSDKAAAPPEKEAVVEQPTDKKAAVKPQKKAVAQQPTDKEAAAPPKEETVAEQPTGKKAAVKPQKKVARPNSEAGT